ncbi:hypothetical protein [Acidisphaera rubrifaciens]|uniref:Pilus assembly protein n=1 Tax=Acidisphaera rubrifaciens HS-AP3 TaxID=1231350 RepID=A0A0D6P4N4_9PROT|nr:hypothetical protein [Acidisphaera rubrifaciens]GAN76612.1 hypothetical protein Asru_0131_04 [Acidisphaera rubrifaciens HS-AP3]
MNRRGTATVEAAMALAFIIVPLCLGTADLALAVTTANRIDRALEAALFYLWANPGTATAAGALAAADASWGTTTPALTVTVSTACGCVSGGYQPAGSVACTGTCPAGETLAGYTTVIASTSVTLPFPLPGLASAYAPSVAATVRTQ